MAWSFDVNGTIPANGTEMFFRVKTLLKSQGWTVSSSSDGTTYNPSGDQLTTASSGAGGFDNTRAWYVLTSPNHARQMCMQRGADSSNFRLKYSGTSGFTGGSPAATVTPSATDEQIMIGSGTDASPTFSNIIDGVGLQRMYMVAGGAAESYSWLVMWMKAGVYGPSHYFGIDVMQPGSFHPSDIDPCVVLLGSLNTTLNLTSDLNVTTGNTKCWFRKGFSDGAYQNVALVNMSYNSTTSLINAINGFPYSDNVDALYHATWARANTLSPPHGVKGLSTILRWNGRWRGLGATLSVNGSRDWIQVGGTNESNYYSIPWNGSKAMIKE